MPFYCFTQEENAEISKYTSMYGLQLREKIQPISIVRKPLNESVIRGLKGKYEDALEEKN